MRNKGFTLSELLVSIGIIGVIAALVIPQMHNAMPDRDKAKVLKAYKTLNDTNNEIFNNPSLYMYNDTCQHILNCWQKPLDKDTNPKHDSNNYQGPNKYPALLSEYLNVSSPVSASSVGNSSDYSFTTSDGITWVLSCAIQTGGVPLRKYTITIDVGNPKRQACTYSSSCKNPGQFQFELTNDGKLVAVDALTRAYLMNPNNLNDRDTDLKKAHTLCGGNSGLGTPNPGNEMGTGSNNTSTTTNNSKETTSTNASSER